MTMVCETPRLRLREYSEGDLDSLVAVVGDPDEMRFYPRPKTRDEASAWIKGNLGLYQDHGFGFWVMESIATAEFLGYSGIRPHETLPDIEIGWHTRKKFWNQGIGTEAAGASRDLAFNRFALHRLIAIVHPENIASIHVAENIGMRPERETILDDYPCVVYAIEHP
jgi:RimJ/RimL family protein N-acetyltransferase